MSEEGKNIGATTTITATATDQPNLHPYYGTFQGVANFYPHPQPQPLPPPQAQAHAHAHASPYNYYQRYVALPVYAVVDGRPVREHRLPCCGLGLGWFLFIMGFFLGGVPWYVGAFFLLCVRMDYREKPGLIACTLASLIVMIAVTLGATHRNRIWWWS